MSSAATLIVAAIVPTMESMAAIATGTATTPIAALVGTPMFATQGASNLFALFGHLLLLSLLAVGGALAVVPDVRRVMVTNMDLLTDAQFNASVAIAQAAPGPNVLFVAALGYQAAGFAGAAVALFGILLPSSTLAYVVARWGHAHREWRAVQAFKAGMAPIVVALIFGTGWTVASQVFDWRSLLLAAAVALLAWRTRIHVVVLVVAGGVVGALGWV
jgi:chromate transporter